MSSAYSEYQIKLCPFDPSFNTKNQYFCFKYEICCPQGCCYVHSSTYFQSWYFWLVILILFMFFYVTSWYFKKMTIITGRLRRQQARDRPSSRASSARGSPRRPNEPEDRLLDCLMQTRRARTLNRPVFNPHGKYLEPPPKYGDAVNMTTLGRNVHQIAQIHSNSSASTARDANEIGNPPTYEDATKSQENGV